MAYFTLKQIHGYKLIKPTLFITLAVNNRSVLITYTTHYLSFNQTSILMILPSPN